MAFDDISDARRLHALLEAILLIESELDLDDLLYHIVSQASQLVGARYGALGVLADDGIQLEQFVTYGLSEDERLAIGDAPRGDGLLGTITRESRSHRLASIKEDRQSVGFPTHHPVMSTFLGVPVRTSDGRVFGNLYLTEKDEGQEFTDEDQALIEGFGRAAGLLVDEAKLRSQVHSLTLIEERARLARDLHDSVIQRVFAVGLALASLEVTNVQPPVAFGINEAITELDAIIQEIRATIFEIVSESDVDLRIRSRVLRITDEVALRLLIPVDTTFEGPLDAQVGPHCANHLTRSLRELLTNVIRHAHAKHVTVTLELKNNELTMKVVDDGVGISGPSGGRGLANVANRAEQLGGHLTITKRARGGTIATWTARELS